MVPTSTPAPVTGGLPYATATNTTELIADINYANTNTGSFTINLTDSTYNFMSADNNTFGPNALPVITGDITINGNGAVLQRDPSLGNKTPFRFFDVSGSQVASPSGSQSSVAVIGSLTLENLTLMGGLAEGGSSGTGGGGLGAGGAILNMGNLTLNGVTVEQNDAVGGSSGTGSGGTSGGGLGSGATTSGNFGVGGASASNGPGGAGGFGGGGGAGTKGGVGGFGAGSGNGSIGGGGAGMGGGIFSMYGSVTLINSTLANNLAQGGQGATSSGGGYGGAVFNLDGTLNVITSTLADNSTMGGAGSGGGAVYNLALGNDSSGSAAPSTVNLTDSILADSLGGDDLVNDENSSAAGAATVNATTPNIVTTLSTLNSATTNGTPITSNPDLTPLSNNGGLTQTMSLMPNSPALGAGTSGPNVPATDQRGVARGSVLDLGASQGTSATAIATTLSLSSSTPTASSGVSVTLTATVTPASGGVTPAGNVTFVDTTTGKTLGSAAPSNGQATFTTTAVSSGDSITATYSSTNGMGNSNGTATVPIAGGGLPKLATFNGLLVWPSTSGSSPSSSLPTPATAAQAQYETFLNQVYLTLLGRPIDTTGLAQWSSDLEGGMTPSQVVGDIEKTTEFQTDEVNAAFQQLLGATAPSSATSYLVGLMQAGADFRAVEAIIVGTPEFYQNAGGTSQGFLTALYHDFLGRAVDPTSETDWQNLLAAGYNTTEVALGVLYSAEYDTDLVNQDYQIYFGVAPDANSLGAYVAGLQNGTQNNAMVVSSILGSPEYGARYGLTGSNVTWASSGGSTSSTGASTGSTTGSSTGSSTSSTGSTTSPTASDLTYTPAGGTTTTFSGGSTTSTASGGLAYTTAKGSKYTIASGDLTYTPPGGSPTVISGGTTNTTASGGLTYTTTMGSKYTISAGGATNTTNLMGTRV